MRMDSGPPALMASSPPLERPVRTAETLRQKRPVATVIVCAICIVIFFGLAREGNRYSWEALEKWGSYPADKIRAGALWSFFTSVFVHLELWHVAFNVYWLYVLGARLEKVIGWWRWLVFFGCAAFLSSGAEFAVSDSTGIGASGVVYAIFGFMWVMRERQPSFQKALDSRTAVWFILWLIGCVAMTLTKVWAVGNAAHAAGLLFGVGVAGWSLWPQRRNQLKVGFSFLFLLSVVPLFWAPWSSDWTCERGIRAYERGDYAAAVKWYERSKSLVQDQVWCLQNIALAHFAAGEKAQYQATLEALRKVDEKKAIEVERELSNASPPVQEKH